MPSVNGHSPQAYLGSWKNWEAVSGNISGTWRTASDVYVNHNGTWKQVWVRLTAPTGGSRSISDTTVTISWVAGVGQEGFKLYRDGVFVKDVAANATSTTDPVPALNTTYTYTVSAFAGTTETAQIPCGAAVGYSIPAITTSVSIRTNWGYTNDSWNGNQIFFDTSATPVNNATSYQVSLNGGISGLAPTSAPSTFFGLNQNAEVNVVWRASRMYNGVYYQGPWSTTAVNVKAGRPQVRTARTDDYPVEAWGDQERYTVTGFGVFDRLDTNYNSFGTIVDSYQFRNLSVNFASQITSATRNIELSKPGTNIKLGPSGINNGYNSAVFTDYADQRYRIDPQGTGWFNFNSSNKLTGTIRFNIRFISQAAVAYTIG